ncbi:VWA domain-containing protein [uncultured Roseibium sp.]|uniref:vWA domain-containing protein n=1 Tax=uncultured Roseibium sp. TaxID=1936171 RepID=UPI002632F0BB|nr:VWA domain-containing protein [uncultured Roseibium sp.]
MIPSKRLPKAVLIGSASIVTLAVAAVVTQSIDFDSHFSGSTAPSTLGQQRTEHERLRAETGNRPIEAPVEAPVDAPLPTPAPAPQEIRTSAVSQKHGIAPAGEVRQRSNRINERAHFTDGLAGQLSLTSPDSARPVIQPNDRERFASAAPNPLKQTANDPVSTFSIDVDTASYSFVRASLTGGYLPNQDAVRVEEMINYFPYDYDVPQSREVPFKTSISVIETPWNADTKLMQIGVQGYKVPLAELPPQNLVFLIDTSGSMADANKLPLLQQSFRLLLSSLRAEDEVAIVTYAGSAGVLLEPTRASDRSLILQKIDALTSGGSTAGHAGLKGAYALAEKMTGEGEQTRVILATDGDFNVGLSDTESLKRYISEQRDNGTALSVLGFGRGNYNDELMQTLAQNGQGVAAYIDTLSEARKVLVDQVVSSISMIAQDVKIQVEFNPQTVAEYRLIGYETRALKTEDFRNDKVDAGDIGAGHNVTALYEITPVGSPARKFADLRYGNGEASSSPDAQAFEGELAFVKLRYKTPGAEKSKLISTPVTADTSNVPPSETRFAAAVAAFGQMLKGSDYLEEWTYQDVERLAQANRGDDTLGYRSEFLNLVRMAQVTGH